MYSTCLCPVPINDFKFHIYHKISKIRLILYNVNFSSFHYLKSSNNCFKDWRIIYSACLLPAAIRQFFQDFFVYESETINCSLKYENEDKFTWNSCIESKLKCVHYNRIFFQLQFKYRVLSENMPALYFIIFFFINKFIAKFIFLKNFL